MDNHPELFFKEKENEVLNEVKRLTGGDFSNVATIQIHDNKTDELFKKLEDTSLNLAAYINGIRSNRNIYVNDEQMKKDLEDFIRIFTVVTDVFYDKNILDIDSVFGTEKMDELKTVLLKELSV